MQNQREPKLCVVYRTGEKERDPLPFLGQTVT